MRMTAIVAACILLAAIAFGQSAEQPTAQTVVERAEAKFRENVRNEEVVFAVRIIDERGRANERKLRFLTAYGTGGEGDKVLLRFLEPADIRGVGLLNLENPGGEDTQYLFLRSVGKARRVASSNRRDRFVGTDYSIGDTRLEDMRLWLYRHLEEVTLVLPPAYGGTTTPTYRLEAVPQEGADTDYARRVLWYHRDLAVLVKEEMYDRDGTLTKTRTRWGFIPFTTVGDQTVLRPQFEEMMNNRSSGAHTVLEALTGPELQRRFNQDLPDATFTTRELEKGR